MFIDPSGNIREPGYVNGVWCEDPDAYEFGKDSLVYSSLVTLGEMWKLRENDRDSISALANEVRSIGRQVGIDIKISIVVNYIPDSANATDVVIAAGNLGNAMNNYMAASIAEEKANELYQNRSDGTQHNAFKHAMWNALLTKYIGKEQTKLIADAHEFGAEENYKQDYDQQQLIAMDLWNNAIGREIGETFVKNDIEGDYYDALAWHIVDNINNKTLWVVNWID